MSGTFRYVIQSFPHPVIRFDGGALCVILFNFFIELVQQRLFGTAFFYEIYNRNILFIKWESPFYREGLCILERLGWSVNCTNLSNLILSFEGFLVIDNHWPHLFLSIIPRQIFSSFSWKKIRKGCLIKNKTMQLDMCVSRVEAF